jgi:phosphoglycerate dehydrogenase-like enzyme
MRPAALFLLRGDAYEEIYGEREREEIAGLVDLVGPPQTAESVAEVPELLRETDVLLSGWRLPRLDAAFLAGAPRLRAVFYAAGSVRGFVTDAVWERGIRVTSAAAVNAIPVSEYTLAVILFSLKHGWRLAREARQERALPARSGLPGAFQSTVGLISLGAVGRLVCERLRPFDVGLLAYDPYVSAADAAELGAELCSLEELFERSDVVSCHAPLVEETRGMVTGAHLTSMRPGATLVNTARGAVVRESDLVAVLTRRPDLEAVLDVTDPEPPAPGSPLYTLPNVVLTPHIAGSLGRERRRLGGAMVEELRNYVNGRPLRWEVTRERVLAMGSP